MSALKACIVTGSRSEYGVLQPLINTLCDDNDFDVTLLVCGSHLAPEFGHTLDLIERRDWLHIETVETLMSSDTPVGVCKSMGLGLLGVPEVLDRLEPDLLIAEGDRSEMLTAALAAYNLRIPIAHISGGDRTAGSLDDGYRDCISRLASLHFPDTDLAAGRLRGMEILSETIHCEGCLSLDGLEPYMGERKHCLVAAHPAADFGPAEFEQLLDACSVFGTVRITQAGADAGGRALNRVARFYKKDYIILMHPMKREPFLQMLAQAQVIVGNSSAGIVEAPALGTPSVNIGNRQLGRAMASTIVQVTPNKEGIKLAIQTALHDSMLGGALTQPYKGGNVAERIKERIRQWHTNS